MRVRSTRTGSDGPFGEVAPGVLMIDGGEIPAYALTQVAYLIRDEACVLVEVGCTTAARRILGQLEALDVDPGRIAYVVSSHVHVDHAAGTGFLLEHLPNAQVLAHPRGVRHLVDPARVLAGTKGVFGDSCEEHFGPWLPVPENRIRTVAEGETIPLGGRELTFFHAPGHAMHHVAFHDSLSGGLFCGESLGIPVRDDSDYLLPAGAPPFDAPASLDTIRKLGRLAPRLLFYAHVGVLGDAAARVAQLELTTLSIRAILEAAIREGVEERQLFERIARHAQAEIGLPVALEDARTLVIGFVADTLKAAGRALAPVAPGGMLKHFRP